MSFAVVSLLLCVVMGRDMHITWMFLLLYVAMASVCVAYVEPVHHIVRQRVGASHSFRRYMFGVTYVQPVDHIVRQRVGASHSFRRYMFRILTILRLSLLRYFVVPMVPASKLQTLRPSHLNDALSFNFSQIILSYNISSSALSNVDS
jgi:hypothetical protein